MTSLRQKKKMAVQDKTANRKFMYYLIAIVVALMVLMYFAFRSS